MRKLFLCLTVIMLTAMQNYAQNLPSASGLVRSELPVVYLPENVSVHFISPEPIQYVDISSSNVAGDLPIKNVLRIKHRLDTLKAGAVNEPDAIVTIVGEKFIAQYRIVFSCGPDAGSVLTNIEIIPAHTRPLDFPGIGLSQTQLRAYSLKLLGEKPAGNLPHDRSYGIKSKLNHIYTLGDYIFLDLSFKNETNLKYDIDELRFKIEDKKITKATTVQMIEIKPDFVLFETSFFKRQYRNIFVFKKFTFPGNKMLVVELSEKQLSGRSAGLEISYKDILEADIIPSL
ncbi:conjugative transposon protein TraN [Pedobacter sp. ISL-68]|uniref:conjugative transposon protein TraN n=1 Tax=unclassified Pedobacter TaxID=2628915 RepID=UPI001BE9DD58|nr:MULTISPECIES: conjugative transposon protein TraN [unclassified Pedobacter]MBT2560131.1 conjugative transposon protein TraN [Pedobacter sp. ISL-64]MBT2589110.1 conjugative transposon protein TraN [Pedobacter sp. ISL-68]